MLSVLSILLGTLLLCFGVIIFKTLLFVLEEIFDTSTFGGVMFVLFLLVMGSVVGICFILPLLQ